MRILQLTNRSPYPPKDGGSIGFYNFTKNYFLADCEVTLLMMNTSKHYVDVDLLPTDFTQFAKIHSVYVNNEIKPIPAFLSLLQNQSYNVKRFNSLDFKNKLIEVLQNNEFDIIHIDTIFLGMYIPIIRKYSKAFVALRCWNVEFVIWERLAQSESNLLKKAYLNILAKQLKKYELEVINLPDLLLPISEVDSHHFLQLKCNTPAYVVPGGVDIDKFHVESKTEIQLTLFHLGSLDWQPNQQALIWFIENCWTEIVAKFPNLHFYIAGRNTPEWFHRYETSNIHVVGEVDDAIQFMNSKSIMIVPLLSGSGMRIKILEGMALAKTIISTTIGAEGINVENKKDILIANTPKEFLDAVSLCVADHSFYQMIGENARKTIINEYDNLELVKKLLLFIKEKRNVL